MPISFECSCGKTLQVKDEFAGRRVRCPACSGVAAVPAADPGFEVVDEPSPVPAPSKPAPVRAKPVERPDDEEDKPRSRKPRDEDDDRPRTRRRDEDDDEDDDDRPRTRRRNEDDDEDDAPRKKKSRRKPKPEEKPSHFGLEKRVLNGGVAGGLLAMVIAVVWFVVGLMADRIFFYPPILFVVGLIAMIKGAVGGNDE
ncbi:MAG: hypothetical protein JWO38_7296 [Gemmataceae bacterium]|nr:hypothetical protein [Gemmataceae bacterium]